MNSNLTLLEDNSSLEKALSVPLFPDYRTQIEPHVLVFWLFVTCVFAPFASLQAASSYRPTTERSRSINKTTDHRSTKSLDLSVKVLLMFLYSCCCVRYFVFMNSSWFSW